jgi:endonuclease/exonuclease/phosphatase family metal-dependent hydrolase
MTRTLIAALLAIALVSAARADTPPAIRVMSFNIRYGTAADGENHWEKRKEFLAETIREFKPDLLGTQETLGFQRDYLAKQLEGYEVLGVGRDDGKERGEMMALYYRAKRFEKLAGGHFWLSEKPDEVGSKSWDSSLPRMASWVKLRDMLRPAEPIFFVNTHFDHRGPEARLESAKLLRTKIKELGDRCAVIATGDFNAGEGSPPYRALFDNFGEPAAVVVDSFRRAHPERTDREGTMSGFKGGTTGGARIDWIGVSPSWQITAAEILRPERNGRTPSDHHPVMAVLAWPGK